MKELKNSKMQGNVGLGAAIAHYTSKGYTVSIPLNDSQDYDLIVDSGLCLKKIQVKTTTAIKNGNFNVSLKSSNLQGSKNFDKSKVDEVFIFTEGNDKYIIPAHKIDAVSNITLGDKYEEFKVAE